MEQILQIPAELTKAETRSNRSMRLIFQTQEGLSDEQYSKIMAQHEKLGWLSFLVGEKKIEPEDLLNLPELPDEASKKSPSERLRAVLYLWHKERGLKESDFPVFYQQQMEKIIMSVKEKLN